jgi:hypothetical protein
MRIHWPTVVIARQIATKLRASGELLAQATAKIKASPTLKKIVERSVAAPTEAKAE